MQNPKGIKLSANIESLNNIPFINTSSNKLIIPYLRDLTIHGWAFDSTTSKNLNSLYVQVDDRAPIECTYGNSRKDVAKSFSNPNLLFTGFNVTVPFEEFTEGDHSIILFTENINGDRLSYSIEVEITFDVDTVDTGNIFSKRWNAGAEATWLKKLKILDIDEEPLVSIVMPVKDRSVLMSRAIDSILSQSYSNWELLIVDDNSVDNSRAVAQSYSKADRRIKSYASNGTGVSAARNLGIYSACGDFIAFLDTDNEWKVCYLATMISSMCVDGAQIAYCAMEIRNKQTDVLEYLGWPFSAKRLSLTNFIDINTLVIAKSIVSQGIHFDEELQGSEDWDFVLQISKRFDTIRYLPFVGITYYTDADNRVTDTTKGRHDCKVLNKHWIDWPSMDSISPDKISVAFYQSAIVDQTAITIDKVLKSAALFALNVEILLICDYATIDKANRVLGLLQDSRIQIIDLPYYPSKAIVINYAASKAVGEYFLFCDNIVDVEPVAIKELLLALKQNDILGAQALILNSDATIQSAGIVFDAHSFFPLHYLNEYPKSAANKDTSASFTAISPHAMMIKSLVLRSCKGFDPSFTNDWAAIDLCFRASELFGGKFLTVKSAIVERSERALPKFDCGGDNQELFLEKWSSFADKIPKQEQRPVRGLLNQDKDYKDFE